MKRLWIIFTAIFIVSFAVLGWIGTEIFRQAPPIPQAVVTTDGTILIKEGEVSNGQNVWQAMGGMQVGSIWGHGSYVAPDWTADYLHREATFILDEFSKKEFSKNYAGLNSEQQAAMRQRLQDLVRKNTYNEATGTITLDPVRARAFEENLKYYTDVFSNGNKAFAIQQGAQSDPVKLRQMTAFFFWTAWASAANRPNDKS
jgi:nitric oxide reductase subunit B